MNWHGIHNVRYMSPTLSEKFIKDLHAVLTTGTSDSRKDWFTVGEYKKLPNEVGGNGTTLPENVAEEIRKLLADYNALPSKTASRHIWTILGLHIEQQNTPSLREDGVLS